MSILPPMRPLRTVLALVVSAPAAAAQDATQEELHALGWNVVAVTFVLVFLGAAAMWWVNHRYHPAGEKVRAKSRKD